MNSLLLHQYFVRKSNGEGENPSCSSTVLDQGPAVVLSPLLKCQPLSSSDFCKYIHFKEPVLLSFSKDLWF